MVDNLGTGAAEAGGTSELVQCFSRSVFKPAPGNVQGRTGGSATVEASPTPPPPLRTGAGEILLLSEQGIDPDGIALLLGGAGY
jgi:hypothetical protein